MSDKMSGLIWIQTVWHSDGMPEFFSKKVDFEKNQQTTKSMEKSPVGKELYIYCIQSIAFQTVFIIEANKMGPDQTALLANSMNSNQTAS